MHIIPQNTLDWLRFTVFPFKAYAVIAPLLLFISPRPGHLGPTDVDIFLVLSLFPCSLILFIAAVASAIAGPKGFAGPCAGFGAAAFIFALMLLPSLNTA
jgi:hypothetical protein